ncbi:hypothetical protein OKC48_26085 [Methylorubrum extorquens]|uniref:hypothetical protein n=1 Tax=Methylorubrum extorquens TaxID=408 RepID=UPI00223734E5|nr:hypothetical protein [Methylorubrum extorquens]UYW26660.1 hypothetical protein OKC48_26085 [Methylorubrum extorquens]
MRSGQTLFCARSEVLATGGDPRFPDRSGTSALLPRFSHVKVALTCDFDVGSGLTFAIGYRIVYLELFPAVLRRDGGWGVDW